MHEVVEIAILFMVGFLFRPRLLTTFYYVELWDEEGHLNANGEGGRNKRLRPPPLYLIPVPGDKYHPPPAPPAADGIDIATAAVPSITNSSSLIISRKELSTSDLQFTLSSSQGGARRRRRRREQQEQQQEQEAAANAANAAPTTAAGVVGNERAVAGIAAVQQSPSPQGGQEETARLLQQAEGEKEEVAAVAAVEEEVRVKPALQYHASRFLVVQLPNGLYAVAVAEEEGEKGRSRRRRKQQRYSRWRRVCGRWMSD